MVLVAGSYAAALRREIAARNREWARGRPHVESYGDDPVVVYCPELPPDEERSAGTPLHGPRHGNFFDPAYGAILARPQWAKRLTKVHAQGRALPRWEEDPKRKWCELDSCMSSDALLMNVFCAASAVPGVRRLLGVEGEALPEFGWKAKVPLCSGLFDRTEVDMRWGDLSTPQTKTSLWGPPLLVEAKLTESDFQTRRAEVVEAYRDFDAVFDRELLPRIEVVTARRRTAEELPEAYTQEWEDTAGQAADEVGEAAREFRVGLMAQAEEAAPREVRYQSYQLIRNVLAAYATGTRFCVICDERRPDLVEAWFAVMRAVRQAEMRTRLMVLTWQELAGALPDALREFLDVKYGISAPGAIPGR